MLPAERLLTSNDKAIALLLEDKKTQGYSLVTRSQENARLIALSLEVYR